MGFDKHRIRACAGIGLMNPGDQRGDLLIGKAVERLSGHLFVPGLVTIADGEFGQLIEVRRPVGIEQQVMQKRPHPGVSRFRI